MDKQLPSWINENLPRELAESSLFRFKIDLQTIDHYKCASCGEKYEKKGNCTCGSKLKPVRKSLQVDMLPDLDLTYEILEDQMQDLPSQYAFWSAAYSEARLQVQVDERKFKATKGRIIEKTQTEARSNGIKLTADQVRSVVEADSQVIRDDLQLQQSQMRCGKLYHMLEALKMKSELGRSLAGFKRQELERT